MEVVDTDTARLPSAFAADFMVPELV